MADPKVEANLALATLINFAERWLHELDREGRGKESNWGTFNQACDTLRTFIFTAQPCTDLHACDL